MRCTYKDDDGIQCNSRLAKSDKKSPYYGLCYGHALQLGKIPAKDIEQRKKSISEKTREVYAAKAEDKRLKAKQSKSADAKLRKEILTREAEKIYEEVVGSRNFNMMRIINGLEKDNLSLDLEAKEIFAQWWMADAATRKPRTLKEVAELLHKTEYVLNKWIVEEDFLSRIDQRRLNIMKQMAHLIDKVNIVQALVGDSKAKDLFYKQIGVITADGGSGGFEDVDSELLAEAKVISGIEETKSGLIRTTPDEEQDIADLASTLTIDERINGSKK